MTRASTRCSRAAAALVAVTACLTAPAPARAWEAATTHAGLTEQAATASGLHDTLRDRLGAQFGLFEPLIIPPADALPLFEVLGQLNPTHGYAPDGLGKLSALGWLVAGSVIADIPVAAARNHFFDPSRNVGLRILDPLSVTGMVQRLAALLPAWVSGSVGVVQGVGRRRALEFIGHRATLPATEWIRAGDNPLALDGFYAQYRKAVLAGTEGERERHLAGALIAAGSLLHVLQDMASPSHVRDDLGAHLHRVSDDRNDLGSRFERIAALAFGRLGVPAPDTVPSGRSVDAFFHNDDGQGLADWTHDRWFSAGTLPRSIEVLPGARALDLTAALESSLSIPSPAPVAPGLDLLAARQPGGNRLDGPGGVCLANYVLEGERLIWSIADDCALEQIGAILPVASAYGAGMLQHLFRGALAVVVEGGAVSVSVADGTFGAGKVTILWDDGRLVRTALAPDLETAGGAVGGGLASVRGLPGDATRVAALFEGVDANGQPLVAAGLLAL